MGDFFTAPQGSPLPPPEPDAPPPVFEDLGVNLGLGLAKSGTFAGFIAQFGDMLVSVFAKLVGFVIGILASVFASVINVVSQITEDGKFGIGVLVSATVNELFDVKAKPADVQGRQSGEGRAGVADGIANAMLSPLFSATAQAEGGGIVPSRAASDKYLSVVTKMALNGWLEGWVTDGLSAHLLEKYGELKDGIARVLGLGRLSRMAMRSPMKILVQDPYTAFLNHLYRPRHWDIDALMAQLNRGQITRAQLSTPLGNQGYTEAQIDELVRKSQKTLSLSDLEYKHSRGVLGPQYIHDSLVNLGYTDGGADDLMDLWTDKRIQKYRMELVSVGESGYVAGNLDLGSFHTIVTNCGLSPAEQDWIIQVAQLKRAVKIRHLSEGEIIKGIEEGILNFNDLKAWAVREGMPLQEELFLELEVLYAENKASALAKAKAATAKAKVEAANAKLQIAQQKAAAVKTNAALAGLTPAQAATLVKDHIWTIAQYTAFLTAHGFGPDAVQANVELIHAEQNATAAKTSAAGAAKSNSVAKGLNLAQLEKAVIEGIVTEDKLRSWLAGDGYSADDAEIIVDLTHNALTAAQAKKDAAAALHAQGKAKSISIPDLDRAVRLGLTTVDAYKAALQAAHFDVGSIALLVGILQSQVASDKATAAKSAAAGAVTTARGITIGQLASEVIAGIRPIGDYSAALAAANYGHEDQVDLTALLQLKVDQAKSNAVKQAAAAKALSARGISLPKAERAVKLGVVPVSVYTALLQSLHYTPDAVQVLTNTLIAEIGAAKKAQTAATSAVPVLAAKHISLPDLEKAVIAGVRPIGDYIAALGNAGFAAFDVDTMAQLLQLKADQAADAAAAHADAEGVATQKGISLGSEEAAVVAGLKTMADFDALLSALGYDDVDRATLEALLQAKVDAKAAKG